MMQPQLYKLCVIDNHYTINTPGIHGKQNKLYIQLILLLVIQCIQCYKKDLACERHMIGGLSITPSPPGPSPNATLASYRESTSMTFHFLGFGAY